jgi:hypothetical protein
MPNSASVLVSGLGHGNTVYVGKENIEGKEVKYLNIF